LHAGDQNEHNQTAQQPTTKEKKNTKKKQTSKVQTFLKEFNNFRINATD